MQVFISYGKRSSGELLIAYGFIPSESNPYDFVELELALDDEDPLYEAKLTALKDQGLSSYPWYYRLQLKWGFFICQRLITSYGCLFQETMQVLYFQGSSDIGHMCL